jgi:hypothetical protein
MDTPTISGDQGDGGEEWWKQFEDKKTEEKKKKKYAAEDEWPEFQNPDELFGLKNQNGVFIKPAPGQKRLFKYGGTYLKALKTCVYNYDVKFTGGDQYLETSTLTVEQIKKTRIGKLALARDELMWCVFKIYQNDKAEWESLRISGFLVVMIKVAQGETCNNELAKALLGCLQ